MAEVTDQVHPNERLNELRGIRAEVIDFCDVLSAADWMAPSKADGWRVRDVIGHLGSTCKLLLSPRVLSAMFSNSVERLNDQSVDDRRDWPIERVVGEFDSCSRRLLAAFSVAARGPLAAIRVPVAGLGVYPLRLFPSMLVFDWDTHLRLDVASAIGKCVPPASAKRSAVALEWMIAGIEQMNRATMDWVDRPLGLTLRGGSGGCWRIDAAGKGKLRVRPGATAGTVAQISGDTAEFPSWATNRFPWRDAKVDIDGDIDYATRFLDTLNVI
jgi:uncharacterized protein (TIGR03083 family)